MPRSCSKQAQRAVSGNCSRAAIFSQPLSFDLDMAWDIRPAAAHENIDATLNYAAISEYIIAFVQASEFLLVETLAEQLAAKLRKEFDIPWLRLRVTKPDAVKQAAGGVGVLIERGVLPS